MWGGGDCRAPGLYLIFFFASATAFISGIVLFLAIAVKAVTSNPGSVSGMVARSSATANTISSDARPSRLPDAALKSVSLYGTTAALTRLRIAIIAVIAVASIDALRRGGPSLSSRYGRYYLLSAVLTLLLSQLPFAVALVRTWRIPDHAGLALAMAAGTMQVVVNMPFFFAWMNLPATMRDSWSLLHALLGGALVVLAYIAWRASGSSDGDGGLMISIFFGFLAYTVLWRVAHAILSARERVP